MGGVELNVFQASRELARRGHQVDLIYRRLRLASSPTTGVLPIDDQGARRSTTGTRTGRTGTAQSDGCRWRRLSVAAARRRPDLIYGNRICLNGWAVPGRQAHRRPGGVPRARPHRPARERDRPSCVAMSTGFVMVSQFVADLWLDAGPRSGQGRRRLQRHRPGRVPRSAGGEERSAARRLLGPPPKTVRGHLLRTGRPREGDPRAARGLEPPGPRSRRGQAPGGGVLDRGPRRRRLPGRARGPGRGDVRFLPGQPDVAVTLHAVRRGGRPLDLARALRPHGDRGPLHRAGRCWPRGSGASPRSCPAPSSGSCSSGRTTPAWRSAWDRSMHWREKEPGARRALRARVLARASPWRRWWTGSSRPFAPSPDPGPGRARSGPATVLTRQPGPGRHARH